MNTKISNRDTIGDILLLSVIIPSIFKLLIVSIVSILICRSALIPAFIGINPTLSSYYGYFRLQGRTRASAHSKGTTHGSAYAEL